MVLRKDELEAQLHAEKKEISDGKLKDDNPLDVSDNFMRLCEACRRGDLKVCQEMITEGTNINARDRFDYTPLILASLCGHYEVVQLLLESGALCERDTFQGERCLYNALNDKIRNLLLQYDYSKSTDPLQPLASHVTSLLTREHPQTSDIVLTTASGTFNLHKFILSSRSPYFQNKLAAAPETISWKLSNTIAPLAFDVAVRYLYLGEVPTDLELDSESGTEEQNVLVGIDKLSRQLEIERLWEGILEGGDRRLTRQRRTDEVSRARDQLESWYRGNVLKHKVLVETSKANDVKWSRDNAIFADVLLRADEDDDEDEGQLEREIGGTEKSNPTTINTMGPLNGIPVGPISQPSRSPSRLRKTEKSILFPAHRAMLIRSEFFLAMFSSSFKEAQSTEHLQIISIDCSPAVLEIVLNFLYTEKADFPLDLAIDVLFAADLLFIEKLKVKAAVVISTLGNGAMSTVNLSKPNAALAGKEGEEGEAIDIYDVIRAGWLTRVHRLEEFGARYLANRLESYIDEKEFAELIKESASRIKNRQETDSIELLDDIRHYLSERFRLRMEESGLEELMDENEELSADSIQEGNFTTNEIKAPEDEGVDVTGSEQPSEMDSHILTGGAIRTLDGEIAGDEFASDAVNYQILLGKIDNLLEGLKLDA
ncbi:MAG: hypothetical protein M1827_001191 [Pycnora praestabilis]|nr:MAG: hypothetical protein M1827_001191 [Pycnora praestabilis]